MASFNQWIGIGNLTRDPEVRVTPGGTSIAQFGIASNRKFKTGNGQQAEEVLFLDVESWGQLAELVAKYCVKGDPVHLVGRLKFEQWEDRQTGAKRSKIKLVLEGVQFLGRRGQDSAPTNSGDLEPAREPYTTPAPRPAPGGKAATPPPEAIDDDIPF